MKVSTRHVYRLRYGAVYGDFQAHRKHEAYRDLNMAHGTDEQRESIRIDDMDDVVRGITGLIFMDVADGDFNGEIDLW